MAKEVKAVLTTGTPLIVTVANGHKVLSKLKCVDFKWVMQGDSYQTELRVIRLDGYSIILGIDWLQKYGRVVFDYDHHSVSFSKDGKQVTLNGIGEGAKLKTISAQQ